jgi:hypothetical protein
MTKFLDCLQGSTNPTDPYQAIYKGNVNEVKYVWGRMQGDGTLFDGQTPWKALWHAALRHQKDILVWLLRQDFPIDSGTLQEERRTVVEMIQRLYSPIPAEVCKALMDRQCEINNDKCLRILIKPFRGKNVCHRAGLFCGHMTTRKILSAYTLLFQKSSNGHILILMD